MKVSELAKELGYRVVELLELAKDRRIGVSSPKDTLDARTVGFIRAQIPPRSKLRGHLFEVYQHVLQQEIRQKEEKDHATVLRREQEKAVPPAKETPPPAPPSEVAAAAPAKEKPTQTRRTAQKTLEEKKPEPPPAKTQTEPKKAKKAKVVQEFRLGVAPTPAPPKPEKPKVKEKIQLNIPKEELHKPLIDETHLAELTEHHALRPSEVEAYEKDKGTTVEKEKRLPGKTSAKTSAEKGLSPKLPPVTERRLKPPPPPPRIHIIPKPVPRPPISPEAREFEIFVPITVKDFSEAVGVKVNLLIKKLLEQGAMATINAWLDGDTVELLALEFNRRIIIKKKKGAEESYLPITEEKGDPKDLLPRAPVVTFMGHVDHGKTSLLDKIRNTNVAAGESGGITQHISAFKLKTSQGKEVTFLDTPGHEAFTALRARGAKVADVAVLVVAADDGVMSQTKEAFNHAKAANVKIVVAINKCDKREANPNKVKQQLSQHDLIPEEWGGNTVMVEVSALTGHNVDHLVEMLSLEADLLELKANPKRLASGLCLEARKTEAHGVLVDLLIQNGTLRRGDVILCGSAVGRVRSMTDSHGRAIAEALPSTPVKASGFGDLPEAGERFTAMENFQRAKAIAEERGLKTKELAAAGRQHVTLEGLFSQIESGKTKEVRMVLKADVTTSANVLSESLKGLSTQEVKIRILHSAVGSISGGDVLLADASDGIVVGFNVGVEERAQELAKDKGVDIRSYTVIYEVLEEMKAALEGLLEPEKIEVKTGHLAVKETFRISRVGTIAGCLVTNGKIERSSLIRLIRNSQVKFEGKLDSLKRFKDDVREVAEGYECGVKLSGHDDVQVGDLIEVYAIQKVARKLDKK